MGSGKLSGPWVLLGHDSACDLGRTEHTSLLSAMGLQNVDFNSLFVAIQIYFYVPPTRIIGKPSFPGVIAVFNQ